MQFAPTEKLINGRYQLLQSLGEGGMGIVHRCMDRVTGTELAIKRVRRNLNKSNNLVEEKTLQAIPNTLLGELSTDAHVRLTLSHEFQTLASLRHPHIISVLDYGFDELGQPFFTMPLIPSPQTITTSAKNQPIETKLRLIGEMLQAVAYLHRRGIIHRDLKPDNVLVTSENRVKVLDFGLAVAQRQVKEEENVSGTIPYMAPEVLGGQAVSFASDLYAVGMIMIEIINGAYPFPKNNITQLLTLIMTSSPDLSSLDISADLQDFIERLINRDVSERFADADTALDALIGASMGQVVVESEEVRDSILQSARFIGREAELKALSTSLMASTKGLGSTWLIGGESGVGKSRLIEELRTIALINGITVLRGQAISGGENAFALWRDPIRRLLLTNTIEEQDAQILKTLIPDIEQLLGYPIPDSHDASANTSYLDQLSSVIAKLFRQQRSPVMLILEDLQWAEDGLSIVKILNNIVADMRLFIVATFRDDENAALPEQLPAMNYIHLERLKRSEIEELSQSMLGNSNNEQLIELLHKETEGNVLFVIEVLRNLAQVAGKLGHIGSMTLPKEVTAGGINEILRKRLKTLSHLDTLMLRYAALAGREIDVKLLSQIAHELDKSLSLEDWLARCLNNGVLALQDTIWRFSHERLRQLAVAGESPSQMQALHQQLAESISKSYPNSPQRYAALQNHWQQAGNLAKELEYALAAADYAMKLNTFKDAAQAYGRALEIAEAHPELLKTMRLAQLMLKLGEAQYHASQYLESKACLRESLSLIDKDKEPRDYAEAQVWLSYAHWRLGEAEAARDAANIALAIAQQEKYDLLVVNAYGRLGQIAYEQGNYSQAKEYWQSGLSIGEAYPQSEQLGAIYNGLGSLSGREGAFDQAATYFEKTVRIYERIGARHRVVIGVMNMGIIFAMRGDLDRALRYFEETLAIAREIGDQTGMSSVLGNLGYLTKLMKQYEKSREYLTESLELAQAIGNRNEIVAAIVNLGHLEAEVGDTISTRAYFQSALREAYEISAYPHIMEILTELARIESHPDRQIQWLGLVLASEVSPQNIKESAQAILDSLSANLDAALIAEEAEIGAKRSLEAVVTDILGII